MSPPSDIPPSPSSLLSPQPESLGDDQIERTEDSLKAPAGGDMTGKHGKMKLKRILLESSLVVTGLEILEPPRLLTREMQQTAIDGCMHTDGSSELGEAIFLQGLVGMESGTTLQVTARREIVILPMSWKQGEVKLYDGENK